MSFCMPIYKCTCGERNTSTHMFVLSLAQSQSPSQLYVALTNPCDGLKCQTGYEVCGETHGFHDCVCGPNFSSSRETFGESKAKICYLSICRMSINIKYSAFSTSMSTCQVLCKCATQPASLFL